ncbi:hypothetical protein GCM10017044_25230 [Kordiimonas sediminis]|uniref:DUF819 family protein n=1 Tax=Kordiimonas sediminis TaxID=1735581 RepID=A0A919AWE9_9PROT|nr:DUF819 family protein [Kordiimonas sediminis]GHF28936.1 hypothetical protein GCM10017044_25230 [Kordiimonas sediminis]
MPLISADSSFMLWAIMLLAAAAAFRLEKKGLGQKLSGPIIAILVGAVLANFNVVPRSAEPYGTIWSYGIPTAIVLLLFGANMRKIFAESGRTLVAFFFGALGTTLGALIGAYLLPLGPSEPSLAAVFSATYIGGSLNFAAVSEAIGFQDSSLLTASLAADNVVGVSFLAVLIALPSSAFIARQFKYKKPDTEEAAAISIDIHAADGPSKSFSPERAAIALGLSFLVVALSNLIAGMLGYDESRLLIATVLIVLIASLFHQKMEQLTEAFPLGMIVMYMFFFLIGAGVDIKTMVESGLMLAAFAVIILATHLLVLLVLSRIFKLDLPEVLVGSNACVLGPPVAAAMAGANGWRDLITPAILCGTLGYTIANFIGLGLYSFLS